MSWKGKLLSMVSRLLLIKIVFQSLLLHSFMIYLWPRSLIRQLNSCACKFLWSGDVSTRKAVTVDWDQVCSHC